MSLKVHRVLSFIAVVVFSATGLSLGATPSSDRFIRANKPKVGEYIVILDPALDAADVPGVAAGLAKDHGGKLGGVITSAANGFFVTEMNEARAIALSRNPHVLVVEENGYMEISASRPTTEWHLDRIDPQGLDGQYSYCETGAGVYVYVVDTGVAKDHQEFQTPSGSKVLDGVSFANDWHPHPGNPSAGDVGTNPCGGFTNSDSTPELYFRTYIGGHGTSVASLIAGNTLGVAPDVKIVPVKIGSCDWSLPVIETYHLC